MTILIDNSKAVEISIREWDEENTQYGLDWSADFYDVGIMLPPVNTVLERLMLMFGLLFDRCILSVSG